MVEILIKVGDGATPTSYKDGDIIEIIHPEDSKRVWEEMLANGSCTKEEYEKAQIEKDARNLEAIKEDATKHS